MTLFPELGFAFVTLVNGDDAQFLAETAGVIYRTLLPLPAPTPGPDLTVHPETFSEEVGTYEDPHLAGTVTISLEGGRLRLDSPRATAADIPYDHVLTPTSPRNFGLSIGGDPYLLTFIHGGPGQPVYLRTRMFVAVRSTAE